MHRLPALLVLALLSLSFLRPAAAQAPSVESQLRDALKSTQQSLHTAQADLVTAQAATAKLTTDNAAQAATIADLIKSRTKDQSETAAAAAAAKLATDTKLAAAATELTRLKTELAQVTAARDTAAALAESRETARARLAEANLVLQRTVADRQTKNLALVQLANEILDRYAKYSLGDALAAKEPFIGNTRSKLEDFVQTYRDKILDQHASP